MALHVSGLVTGSEAITVGTGGISMGANGIVRTGREFLAGGNPKVGATSGWVVNAAADLFEATCPASQTGSTLIVPVRGLVAGDTITGFRVVAQIESAGGAVTLDADLRAQTNVAADPTDASIGSVTQVAVSADTAVSVTKTALTEVVVVTKNYYIKITATTAGSTDIRYLSSWVTVTTS
jgi:hypothetical protein